MNYTLFLGCIAPLRYPGIESSTLAVMKSLGIKLHQIDGFSCCPAPGLFKPLNKKTWLILGARNLSLASERDCGIITVCNGCQTTLSEVSRLLRTDQELKGEINKALSSIGRRYDRDVTVRHCIDFLYEDVGVTRIKKMVKNPLSGLKVAVHYGCHYLLEARETEKNFKNPEVVERLVEATGADVIEYEEKTMCCGAGKGLKSGVPDVASEVVSQKLESIAEANADCIVVICSFCQLQLDQSQAQIEKFARRYQIPVLHYLQLLHLALESAVPAVTLGFKCHSISPDRILRRLKP